MKTINVDIYNWKNGKKEIEYISCDVSSRCSFYEAGKCLNCRTLFGKGCIYGGVITETVSSKTAKGGAMLGAARGHAEYAKLKYPTTNAKVAVIDGTLRIDFVDVSVYKWDAEEAQPYSPAPVLNEWGYVVENGGHNSILWLSLPLSEEDIDFLAEVFEFDASAATYEKYVVPDILTEMRMLCPNVLKRLVEHYPQFDIIPVFVGKNAYIKTMADGSVLEDFVGNEFTLKDGKLCCEHFRNDVPFGGKSAKVEVELTGRETYCITDNSQVTEHTRFV